MSREVVRRDTVDAVVLAVVIPMLIVCAALFFGLGEP